MKITVCRANIFADNIVFSETFALHMNNAINTSKANMPGKYANVYASISLAFKNTIRYTNPETA